MAHVRYLEVIIIISITELKQKPARWLVAKDKTDKAGKILTKRAEIDLRGPIPDQLFIRKD